MLICESKGVGSDEMKAASYRKKIIANMIEVGTYKPEFGKVIDTLAQMYEDIDTARDQFDKSGGNLIIKHTNKSGATNLVKNPFFLIIENLQANILQYNRELGLTPRGLKNINEKEMTSKKKKSKLEAAMEKIAGG